MSEQPRGEEGVVELRAAVQVEPGYVPLGHPAEAAQPLARRDAFARGARGGVAAAQQDAVQPGRVGLVGVPRSRLASKAGRSVAANTPVAYLTRAAGSISERPRPVSDFRTAVAIASEKASRTSVFAIKELVKRGHIDISVSAPPVVRLRALLSFLRAADEAAWQNVWQVKTAYRKSAFESDPYALSP
jgi:hypothetical protein